MAFVRLFLFGLLGISVGLVKAQQPYFQQEVNYSIRVQLDENKHRLRGHIRVQYRHNGSEPLTKMYWHLWPNAYSSRRSAYARQQLQQGNTAFYFATPDQQGAIDSLAFEVNGQPISWQIIPDTPDVALLMLPQALLPGQTIAIATPFRVRIPHNFSRMGRIGRSYQLTQWFPKPAVYDREGWHPMPYLDAGEFYSEFGDFEVHLDVPASYIVAATGVLQNEAEKQWLQTKARQTLSALTDSHESFPQQTGPAGRKTLTFHAAKVHDFAWFADPEFQILHDTVSITGGQAVETWAFFKPQEQKRWQNILDYTRRALQFYSEKVGPYPYPQMSVVSCPEGAPGGMEYPMITALGYMGSDRALDQTAAHEIGHNWWYGILASNERDHAWMDEGINSYYEKRYMRQYYPLQPDDLPQSRRTDIRLGEFSWLLQARTGIDMPVDLPADRFPLETYFTNAYEKPAIALELLAAYTGQQAFDTAIQSFYRQWQFRHPQPADIKAHLENNLQLNLDWFFKYWLLDTPFAQYEIINRLANGVVLGNKGNWPAPVAMVAPKDSTVIWSKGFTGLDTLLLPSMAGRQWQLDPYRLTPQLFRKRSFLPASGSPKQAPVRLGILTGLDHSAYRDLYALPVGGWNAYDGLLAGAVLHNYAALPKPLEWMIAPEYGFKSKSLLGYGELFWQAFPRTGPFQKIRAGLDFRRFHFQENGNLDYRLDYLRWSPQLSLKLKQAPLAWHSHFINWNAVAVQQAAAQFDASGKFTGTSKTPLFFQELQVKRLNRHPLRASQLILTLDHQRYEVFRERQDYLRLSLEHDIRWLFQENKGIRLRTFAGTFLLNPRRNSGALLPGAFSLTGQGFNDIRYSEYYFGRSEPEGWTTQQIALREGGFKNAFGRAFSEGRSNSWMLAFNLSTDLPPRLPSWLPLQPYFDAAYVKDARPSGIAGDAPNEFWWSGGLSLRYFQGQANVYFPLVHAKNIRDLYGASGRSNFGSRITFSLNMSPPQLLKWIARLGEAD